MPENDSNLMATVVQTTENITPTSKNTKKVDHVNSVEAKIYVLDTCVLLYDHSAINNFEENQIAIPITVLEAVSYTHLTLPTKRIV